MNDIVKQDQKFIKVDFRDNNMEAYVTLSPSEKGYTSEEILEFLRNKAIIYGILEDVVAKIAKEKTYNRSILVAKGLEKIDGKDGYYDFNFDYRRDNRPEVLIDGSVNYKTLQIVRVKEGDVLVTYTPAEPGEIGYDVKGKALLPYRGKDMKPIKGKGFTVSEDRRLYKAALTGKVDYAANKLVVSNVLEVRSDVDHLTGDIEFDGDVIIYGNVTLGTSVKAKGNVTVQGHMEGAEIIAGKEVILQNGAQGAGRGRIETKGSVSGKFFEQMIIRAGGDVNANSILNCDVECGGEVLVSGKLGILVGGRVKSLKQITATIIGNMAEIRTELETGLPDNAFYDVSAIDYEIQTKNSLLEKIDAAAEALTNAGKAMSTEMIQQKKLEIMRTKIKLNMEISEMTQKRSELITQLDYVPNSRVVATKRIHPGVRITVNGETTLINGVVENVTVRRRGQDVCLFSNE